MWTRLGLILGLAVVWPSTVSAASDKVVCYHGTWSYWSSGNNKFTIPDIDTNLCTHVNYAFVGINPDGTIRLNSDDTDYPGFLAEFSKLKNRNPKPKLFIAIGGWSEGSTTFSIVARNSTLRRNLLNSALGLIERYNLDGFDFDWEYPTQRGGIPEDKQNFVTLLKEFRTAFNSRSYLLSAAVAAGISYYDVPGTASQLDFINVMTYDFAGSWSPATAHHSSYPDSISSINSWIKAGAPPEKLVLGIGTYGRSFTLRDPNNNGVGAPRVDGGDGYWGYNDICQKVKSGWNRKWSDDLRVPYAHSGNQWVGYDDPESIAIKAKFVVDTKLGGIMIWSAETDDFRGLCGVRNPLLTAINVGLNLRNSDPGSGSETNPSSEKPKDIEKELCTAAEYVRDPQDCTKYYYCQPSGGGSYIPLSLQCPGGLYYDVQTGSCNWPDLVPCP